MKARRSFAGFMAVLVLCFSVIYPAREARAVIPLAIPLVASLMGTGGAVVAADLATAALSALVGGLVVAMIITPAPIANDTSQVRIPLSTSSASAAAIDTPVAPVLGAVKPADAYPSGVTDSYSVCRGYAVGGANNPNGPGVSYGTCETLVLCRAWASGGSDRICGGAAYAFFNNGSPVGTVPGLPTLNLSASCGPGYTLSGSSCPLTNARAVVADGKQDFSRSGTVISPYPNDLKGTINGAQATTSTANDTVVVSGKNTAGQPVKVTTQALSSGGGIITVNSQKVDANGNSYVETRTINIASDNTVTSASQTTQAQTMSVNTSTGQYDLAASPTNTATPAATQQPIVFPDDYARQGTLTQVVTNTGTIANALTTSAAGVVDPALPGSSQFDDAFFKTTFNGLLSWSLPAHSSSCPTSSFDAWGRTFSINAHCALVDNNFAGIRQAMAVVYLLLAMFIVLRA